jgi:hypothetical protein
MLGGIVQRNNSRAPTSALVRSLTGRALQSSKLARLIDGVGMLGPAERKTFEGLSESWGIALSTHLLNVIESRARVPQVNGDGADSENTPAGVKAESEPGTVVPKLESPSTDEGKEVFWIIQARAAIEEGKTPHLRADFWSAIERRAKAIQRSDENLVSARKRFAQTSDGQALFQAHNIAVDRLPGK